MLNSDTNLDDLKLEIKQILVTDTEAALAKIQSILNANAAKYNEFLLHQAAFNRINAEVRQGLLTAAQAIANRAQLDKNLMDFVDTINANDLATATSAPNTTAPNAPHKNQLSEIEKASLQQQKSILEKKIAFFEQKMLFGGLSLDQEFATEQQIATMKSQLNEIILKIGV